MTPNQQRQSTEGNNLKNQIRVNNGHGYTKKMTKKQKIWLTDSLNDIRNVIVFLLI